MDVRQQNIPAFFIDNDDDVQTIAYIDKNAPLLKGHLLVFSREVSAELTERCEAWGLCHALQKCRFHQRGKSVSAAETKEKQGSADLPKQAAKREILRTVRSGESIEHSGDLLISGNVNDGASIVTEGTLTIFGIIEGDISCNGSYMIITACNRGKVIFHGIHVNDLIRSEKLKIFYMDDGEVAVKELM